MNVVLTVGEFIEQLESMPRHKRIYIDQDDDYQTISCCEDKGDYVAILPAFEEDCKAFGFKEEEQLP